MRSDAFINALKTAGWLPVNDAQHGNIYLLWRSICPAVASAEDGIEILKEILHKQPEITE